MGFDRFNNPVRYEDLPRQPLDNSDSRLDAEHAFERAGLGKAPFIVIGFSRQVYQAVPGDPNCPLQPGCSCDYCGMGIMYVARVKASDGKEFNVGCNCVEKVGAGGLLRNIKRHPDYRRIQREISHARATAIKAEVDAFLADPDQCAKLGPDYYQIANSVRYSGASGYARNRARIRRILAGATQ